MVCREAWKRPTRRHSRNASWTKGCTHTHVDRQKRYRTKNSSINTQHGFMSHTRDNNQLSMLTYLLNFFCMYFPSSFINTGMAIFFWLFQFQFQFFTLNTENSDMTKSRKVNCDSEMTNLSLQEFFFSSESFLHEPPSSDLLTIWGGTEDRALHLPTQGPGVGSRGKNSIPWVGS